MPGPPSPPSPPSAVTLDLFGTLVDFDVWRDEPPLVRRLLDAAGSELDEEEVLGTWFSASMEERGRTPFRTVHEALVVGAQETAEVHELEVVPESWAHSLAWLWRTRPLVPEATEALDLIAQADAVPAIVSNIDRPVLEEVLARNGLHERIHVVVCSHDVEAYKPDPAVFQAALDKLGVHPEDAVHVGDSEREDRPGATAAGMAACVLVGQAGGLLKAVGQALGGKVGTGEG